MPHSVNLKLTNTKSSVIAKLQGQYEWTERYLGGKRSFKINLQNRKKITEQVSTYCQTVRGLIKINEGNYSIDEQSRSHESIDVLISV